MLSLSPRTGGARGWKPPILATVAARQEGIGELWEAILAHRTHLRTSGLGRELAEQRLKDETGEVVAELARQRARRALAENPALVERLLRDGTPYSTAVEILGRDAT
jgi:LAO/AO transport system kinase